MTFPSSESASATTKRFVRSAISDRQPPVLDAPPQDHKWHPPLPRARQRSSPAQSTQRTDRSSRTPARVTPRPREGRPHAPRPPPQRGSPPDEPPASRRFF